MAGRGERCKEQPSSIQLVETGGEPRERERLAVRPGDPGSNLPSNLFSASFRPALVFFLAGRVVKECCRGWLLREGR